MVILCLQACLVSAASQAEESPAHPPLPGQVQRPPSPPPMPPLPGEAEARLLDAVFQRFPGIDRGEMERFLREVMPQELAELRRLSQSRFDEALGHLAALVQRCIELQATQRERPALYERLIARQRAERHAEALGRMCRREEGGQKEARLRELAIVLADGFELRQEIMRMELAHLQDELGQLEALIAKRQASREAIMALRKAQLLGDGEGMEW